MSGDCIKTFKLEVEIQENGIIRDPFGWIIGRCNKDWLENHNEEGGTTSKVAQLRWDGSEFHRDVVDVRKEVRDD